MKLQSRKKNVPILMANKDQCQGNNKKTKGHVKLNEVDSLFVVPVAYFLRIKQIYVLNCTLELTS
jgi:hypothetical protein